MVNKQNVLHFTTSVEMVLKELREEKGLSQADVNIGFSLKYKITLNMGRMEANPNFGMTKLYLLCDYFDISVTDFFQRVASKDKTEIADFLKQKELRKKHRTRKNKR